MTSNAHPRPYPLSRQIIDFLEYEQWPFERSDSPPGVQIAYQGEHGLFRCFGRILDEKEQAIFHTYLETPAPDVRRGAVAELLTRLNHGMVIGNFEMDFADGEVCFKTSIDVEGGALAPRMIENLIFANLTAVDKYAPSIRAVMNGEATPQDAMAKLEQAQLFLDHLLQ